MKKVFLALILLSVSILCWAWSPYDTYETGEQVAAMTSYTKQEMIEYQPQMVQNYSGGLSWELRFTGGRRINSFLYYNEFGKLIEYEILLPYSEGNLEYIVNSSNANYYSLLRQGAYQNGEFPLGIVYKDRNVEISCTIILELMSLQMRPEYYVKYLN
jgi:hypothetical protein